MLNKMTQLRSRRAFSILELMIALAILLLVGGLVAYNFMGASEKADVRITKAQIDAFETALDAFKIDMKRWPTEEEGLTVLWSKDAVEDDEELTKWDGPYLDDVKSSDVWGNDWVYQYPGEIRGERFFDIISAGPDREEDSEDDITNHDDIMSEDGEIGDEFEEFTPSDGIDE